HHARDAERRRPTLERAHLDGDRDLCTAREIRVRVSADGCGAVVRQRAGAIVVAGYAGRLSRSTREGATAGPRSRADKGQSGSSDAVDARLVTTGKSLKNTPKPRRRRDDPWNDLPDHRGGNARSNATAGTGRYCAPDTTITASANWY